MDNYYYNQGYNQGYAANPLSLYRLQCPYCGVSNFQVLGIKGAKQKSIGIGTVFGALGNMVASSVSKNDYSIEPLNYKCNSCGNKFEAVPFYAQPDEILPAPCRIIFTNMSSSFSTATTWFVWLNGVKTSPVGSGKTIEFMTYIRFNTLFVTDQYGAAFKNDYKFEAPPGGYIEARFNKEFK